MIINIKLDKGAYKPTKAYEKDAGYDLYAREDKRIWGWSSEVFDTGVHIQLPEDTKGQVEPRSGLNIRNDLFCFGVIDPGYTGSIAVKLYNHSCNPVDIKAGDRIAQISIVPVVHATLSEIDCLDTSERGSNGFGSSGR